MLYRNLSGVPHSVPLNILRLGAYELLHRKDLAAPIVISEAIRLAERFSSAESPRFVNGVLAGISKTERPA